MAYAHELIEVTEPDGSKTRYKVGDEVPDSIKDVPEYDELIEGGYVRDEPYDPDEHKLVPEVVEIDGVKYVRVGDNAETEDARN